MGIDPRAWRAYVPLMDDIQQWKVGDVTVTGVCEAQTDHIPPQFFFPDATAEAVSKHAAWLVPDHADDAGNVSLRVQAFVVEIGSRTIVVDPCVGNGRDRSLPFWSMQEWPFLERFESAGFDVSRVDQVVHTHLHADHVGWGTRPDGDGGWTPTFVNARYLYTERELAFADGAGQRRPERVRRRRRARPRRRASATSSTRTPTSATACGWSRRPGTRRATCRCGSSPTARSPSSAATGCTTRSSWPSRSGPRSATPTSSRPARRAAACSRQLADTGALLLGTHFGAPQRGRVVRDGAAFRFAQAAG